MTARPGFGLSVVILLGLAAIAALYSMQYLAGEAAQHASKTGEKLQFNGPGSAGPANKGDLRIVMIGGDLATGAGFDEKLKTRSHLQSILLKNITNKSISVIDARVSAGRAFDPGVVSQALAMEPALLVVFLEHSTRARRDLGALLPPRDGVAYEVGSPQFAAARRGLARALGMAMAKGDSWWGDSLSYDEPMMARISAAVAACNKKNVKLVILVVPDPVESDSELRALVLEVYEKQNPAKPVDWSELDRSSRAAKFIKNSGAVSIDLTSIFREGSDGRRAILLNYENGCWNSFAANIVAAQIATHMISSGMHK